MTVDLSRTDMLLAQAEVERAFREAELRDPYMAAEIAAFTAQPLPVEGGEQQ